MDKVRFSCPRCNTLMQTGSDKIGIDVACPQCHHEFRLVDHAASENQPASDLRYDADAPTMPPQQGFQPSFDRSYPESNEGERASTRSLSGSGSTENVGSRDAYGKSQVPQGVYSAGDFDSYSPPNAVGFTCPYCGTSRPPLWKSEVSQLGWVVFAILLTTTCVFCFAGLFIRNRYRVCSNCKVRLE